VLKNRILVIMLSLATTLFFGSENSLAQIINSTGGKRPVNGFIKDVGSDVAHVFSSPFHLSRHGGLQLLALAALTAGTIVLVDEPFDEEYAKEGDNAFYLAHELAEIGQFYDDVSPVTFAIGLSAATLAGGLISKDKKLLTTTRLLVESSALTLVFTMVSKRTLGRSRPYADRGATDFNLFKFSSAEEYNSMPSGHVSSVFAIMTVMAKQYDHWWVEIPAYTFCGAVAFQRMESRSHWFSDTIVGGALGYWVASTLVSHNSGVATNSSFHPYWLGNRVGAVLSF
jgi:membrane-associated phospholipid phosphatase